MSIITDAQPAPDDSARQADALDRADMEQLQAGHDAALNNLMERHAAPVFHFLADSRRDLALATRVLNSLRWYNRSLAIDVQEDVALVSLAVAFESLLDLPRGREVTERFKQAVVLLLGPVARLDSFLEQFYDVRSDLVHSGSTEDCMFRAIDGTGRQRPGPPRR